MTAETSPDVISPELALIDPQLARSARERLPFPGTLYPPRWVPPDRARRAAVPVRAAAVALPTPSTRPAPVRVGPRLLAVAALVPVSVALALVADFLHESGGQAFEGSAPPDHQTAARAERARSQPSGPPGSRALPRLVGGTSARAGARRTGKRGAARWVRRSVADGVVGEIGSRPAALARALGRPTVRSRNGEYCHVGWSGRGLTIVLVAGRTKNPCTKGRVVGGFATGATWRTRNGLHVGASFAQLRRRYPQARTVGSGWWRLGYVHGPRSRARVPLHAHVTAGRVDKILVN